MIKEKLTQMEELIKSCPELFHDGINHDLLDIIKDIKKEIMPKKKLTEEQLLKEITDIYKFNLKDYEFTIIPTDDNYEIEVINKKKVQEVFFLNYANDFIDYAVHEILEFVYQNTKNKKLKQLIEIEIN